MGKLNFHKTMNNQPNYPISICTFQFSDLFDLVSQTELKQPQ